MNGRWRFARNPSFPVVETTVFSVDSTQPNESTQNPMVHRHVQPWKIASWQWYYLKSQLVTSSQTIKSAFFYLKSQKILAYSIYKFYKWDRHLRQLRSLTTKKPWSPKAPRQPTLGPRTSPSSTGNSEARQMSWAAEDSQLGLPSWDGGFPWGYPFIAAWFISVDFMENPKIPWMMGVPAWLGKPPYGHPSHTGNP